MRMIIKAAKGLRVRLSPKIVLGDGKNRTVKTASVELTPFIEQLLGWKDVEEVKDTPPATADAPAAKPAAATADSSSASAAKPVTSATEPSTTAPSAAQKVSA